MTMTLDTALRAIRAKCMDCCGRSKKLVEICQADTCPLHPYRKYEGGAIERGPAGGKARQISMWEEGRK